VGKGFELFYSIFFFRWNEIYRRRFSRYLPICFQERAIFHTPQFDGLYVATYYEEFRHRKSYALHQYRTFYCNHEQRNSTTIAISFRFKKHMNNCKVKLNFGVIYK
jgi:hypothetical protein